jgi:hypothetical protein
MASKVGMATAWMATDMKATSLSATFWVIPANRKEAGNLQVNTL